MDNRPDKKILICTVGLPRSGKTTWARSQGYPIVSPDAIRLAIHGQRFLNRAEPLVWAIAKYMVRALFLAGHDRVILDATSNTRKRRDEWCSHEWTTYFKVFDTPAKVCRARSEAMGDLNIVPQIERMTAEHEPLEIDEMLW